MSEDELAFPQTGADMSEFVWETPTPESYEADLQAMMAANEHITVPESPDLPVMPAVADTEWT